MTVARVLGGDSKAADCSVPNFQTAHYVNFLCCS